MAKIDTTKIKGFAEMSAEEKLEALQNYEYEDADTYKTEMERYKNANSKANSEAAEWKKKHNALLSDEEQKRIEQEEKFSAMEMQLQKLQIEKHQASLSSQYLAMGFDEASATEMSAALASGNVEQFVLAQQNSMNKYKSEIEKQYVNNVGKPASGNIAPPDANYAEMAQKAMASGNMSESAYYTRLAAEAAQQKG